MVPDTVLPAPVLLLDGSPTGTTVAVVTVCGGPPLPEVAASAHWLDLLDVHLRGRGLFRSVTATRPDGPPACWIYAIDDPAERDAVLEQACRSGYVTVAYGLGALMQRPERGRRGCGNDVAAVVTFVIDLDLHDPDPHKIAAVAEVMAKAAELELPVSAIINSGNGLHVYLFLSEPWSIATEDDRVAYAERQRWLADKFGGDHVTDLARCLRLPGSWNRKKPDNPLPCRVLHLDPPARITPGQVPRLHKAGRKGTPGCSDHWPTIDCGDGSEILVGWCPPDPATDLPLPLTQPEAEKLISRLERLARADAGLRVAMSPSLVCKTQSDQDYAAMCMFLELGLTDREALHVARRMREIREGELSAKNARDDYWAITLASAHNPTDNDEEQDHARR